IDCNPIRGREAEEKREKTNRIATGEDAFERRLHHDHRHRESSPTVATMVFHDREKAKYED
ncbi:Hypothetical predicted protein, partial [Olea europaea subsp. europaea]